MRSLPPIRLPISAVGAPRVVSVYDGRCDDTTRRDVTWRVVEPRILTRADAVLICTVLLVRSIVVGHRGCLAALITPALAYLGQSV